MLLKQTLIEQATVHEYDVDHRAAKEVTDGTASRWIVRPDVYYHISNSYFNDLSNVGVEVGEDTVLSLSASARLDEVIVEKGGSLSLNEVNYAVLNSLFTKWISSLELKAGSYIDFPVGTTDEIAAKWLNGVSIDGVNTLVEGKPVKINAGAAPPADSALAKPSIGASHAGPKSVSLSWGAVAGATKGYNAYQALSATGPYQLIAAGTAGTAAVASDLATGSYYWFKAAAVNDKGEGPASDPIQVRARPLRPASISAAPGSKTGSVKVSWGSVADCGGYAVYVSTSRTGTYVLKSVVSGAGSLSAQISGLKSGATYYFKVASYVQVGPAKVPSVYTGVVSAKAK